ncbi:MAG: hypothetical protein JNK68_06540 [Betaproteobacteria bacterium]|nr:hypothetical protein [Betaproteobacteria bacterium]
MRSRLSARIALPGQVTERLSALAATVPLAGCESRVPSINVLGAFFPAWMLCVVAGIGLALLTRALLAVIGLDPWLGPRGVLYPALALAFTLATWVVFFQA